MLRPQLVRQKSYLLSWEGVELTKTGRGAALLQEVFLDCHRHLQQPLESPHVLVQLVASCLSGLRPFYVDSPLLWSEALSTSPLPGACCLLSTLLLLLFTSVLNLGKASGQWGFCVYLLCEIGFP